jgi:tetratricopeptide (TPR) repeat protein
LQRGVFVFATIWHDAGMMIRFAVTIAILLATSPVVVAQAAQDSASVQVAPVAPIDPAKKKAADIDRLLGDLHKKNAGNPQPTIEKIWTLWSMNDSPMAEILLTQSNKALQDGAFDTSEKMLNELVGSYPDYVEALNLRAKLYYNMKRYDDAQTDLEAVLDNEPRHFGALSGLAAVYQAKGETAKAAAMLRDAIAVNPYLESAKQVLKQLEHDFPDI